MLLFEYNTDNFVIDVNVEKFLLNNQKCYKWEVVCNRKENTRVGTLIEATIYLQLMQNRYMYRSFTVFQCSHQHCVQPVASDVEVVGYL